MSQKAFSQKTGIPQSTISDWKGKKVNPAADKIMIICSVLGVDPYDLLSGTEGDNYEKPSYITIGKNTTEYLLVDRYRRMSKSQKDRLLGYLDAIAERIR